MRLFVTDQKKCKRDGICVAECPMGIIALKDQNATPVPADDANELCINCGHCVAVCPHGALSLKTMSPEQCPPVQKDLQFTPEQVEYLLRSRRSVRVYKNKAVDRKIISKLIDMARFAPSGHNLQPVRWLVICDSAEVRKLASLVADWMRYMVREQPDMVKGLHMERLVRRWDAGDDVICRDAPHVIVAHAPKDERTAPAASTIALSYLELAAGSLDLGACWAGYFNTAATFWPPMQEALGLPKGHISYGAMMVGYPKFRYHRLPLRNKARITWR
ncbi:nitroreductase family protein [Desulfonema magnum]|uniref:Ferridoxin n=1 Tax=Desulfonema magnum TaxID=45655 RepID=A0A975GW81_9BACT|nr:nitroreductase family protein [Desulfonema magnum]QTA93793.1 Ferridoxin [Desulfonema magnum]